ncbi:MAG TPA: NAD(P)H-dependent oxidoreductase [Candidatus Acidoferrum sp.]|nr:NAD(P)H-dependent oxidoreductase [Candidatus Acidoferrum sp.]
MIRVLVLYDTVGGNTEKMALAVMEGITEVEEVEAVLKKVDDVDLDDLEGADGIIIGSPTFYGLMSGKLKTLIDKSVEIHGKLAGKVGGAFTSSGGTASGAETTLLSILEAMLIHGMIVQGRFEHEHYGAAAVGAPDKKAVESCKDLGRSVASLAVKVGKRKA